MRMDETGWGFSARGAVEFLTRLHGWLPDGHPRTALMRDRCTRSVDWQFSCQFPDGAVGMHTQDDHWLGMTAAALSAYDHIRAVGWVDEALAERLGTKKWHWQASGCAPTRRKSLSTKGAIARSRAGPRRTHRKTWHGCLVWTVEALLRIEAEAL